MQTAKVLSTILRSEHNARVARRLAMLVVFFTTGGTFAYVGGVTGWDKRTVKMWYERLSACTMTRKGIKKALSDKPRSGSPTKIAKKHLDEAQRWCETHPFSTAELFAKLEKLSGVQLSMRQVQRYGKKWGNSRKKSQPIEINRATMSAVYGWRHRLLAKIAKYRKLGYAIVTMDESHFTDSTRTARYWAKTFLRIFIEWSGDHHRFSMFCSLTLDGRAFFNHAKSADTISFLEHIERVYQEVGKMVLVLDKASYHMSDEAMAYFKKRDIVLVWYPTGHPYLNPVEEVWNVIKSQIDHSIRYANLQTHLGAFYNFVNNNPKINYDFYKFWNRSPAKGMKRPLIRDEGGPDPSIQAQQVKCKPKSSKRR